jgi:hypothetical protein
VNIYAEDVLSLAAKYIGYKEKASNKELYSFDANAGKGNYTMFQAELDNAKFWNNAKQGFEWCTSFIAWCFWRILGNAEAKRVLCLTGDYGAGCTQWASYYKAAGRLFKTPQVGDQYFQKGSDGTPCHTGIVESVNGSTFITIEGNASNMVKRVTRNVSSAYGFGRPYYNESEDEEMVRYKTIDEIPNGYRAETQELINLGFNGKGGDAGLDVTEDMLRTMIVNLRMCKALIAAVPDASIDKDALFEEFKNNLKLSIEIE